MGAILYICKEPKILWKPSGSYFESFLEITADELDASNNSSLAAILRKHMDGPGYLDIRDLNQQSFMHLFDTVVGLQQKIIEMPVSDPIWHMRIFMLGMLIALLYLDQRCTSTKYAKQGRIILPKDVVWEQPRWIYELVLIFLLEKAIMTDAVMTNLIKEARIQYIYDVSALDLEQLKYLNKWIKTLNQYLNRYRNAWIAPAFTEKLYPAAKELDELFDQYVAD